MPSPAGLAVSPPRGPWPFAALGCALAAVVLCLFAWNADACFAVNDALWYAHAAETSGLASIRGHHPLYHLLLLPLTSCAELLGIPHPGHCAARAVSAASILLLALLLGRIARWNRVALTLPLLLCATRSVLLESGVGETVVPAAVLALWALISAADQRTTPLRTGVLLTVALLMRQDNILIVPAVAWILHGRLSGPQRLRQLLNWLSLTGLATLAAYAVCWQLSGDPSLRSFMLSTAETTHRNWAPAQWPGWDELLLRCATLGVAVAGVQADFRAFALNIGIGLLWFATLAAAVLLLRAPRSAPEPSAVRLRSLAAGCALTSALRMAFFLWFEPQNFEWWILELVMATGLTATALGSLRGTGRTALAATALVLLAAGGTFSLHASSTLTLRATTLHEAAEVAEEWSRAEGRPIVLTHGFRPHTALHLRGLAHDAEPMLGAPPPEVAGPLLTEYLLRAQRPVIVLLDRFVGDGHPAQHASDYDAFAIWLDAVPEQPPMRAWRRNGKAQVLWLAPPP